MVSPAFGHGWRGRSDQRRPVIAPARRLRYGVLEITCTPEELIEE